VKTAIPTVPYRPDPTAPHSGVRWLRQVGVGASTAVIALCMTAGCSSGTKSTAGTAAAAASSGTSSAATSSSAASSAASMAGSSSKPAAAAMIMIKDFKYITPASVRPGATVSVMNMDGQAHTVTADSGGAFDDTAAGGSTTTFKAPMKPGSYPFHCTFHGNMHGVLVVK
jgi:plastocyanin